MISTNFMFPNWNFCGLNAFTVEEILGKFDLYVSPHTEGRCGSLVISFFPLKMLNTLPPKESSKFRAVYSLFVQWLSEELDLEHVMSAQSPIILDSSTGHILRDIFWRKLLDYNAAHKISIQDILYACFGAAPFVFIPEPLRSRMRELVVGGSSGVATNFMFPNWQNSKIIIRELIEQFDVYTEASMDHDSLAISVSFFPDEVSLSIPVEYSNKFDSVYAVFSRWISDELDLEEMLQEYVHSSWNDHADQIIREAVRDKIRHYNYTNKISVQEILRACFGDLSPAIIPSTIRPQIIRLTD